MQPQERRFADTAPQQPVYRFQHQNTPAQGWQPQGMYQYPPQVGAAETPSPAPLSKREQRRQKRREKRRRHSLIWNIFAVIGIVTVIIQAVRYVIVPLLVYLNVLAGGVL